MQNCKRTQTQIHADVLRVMLSGESKVSHMMRQANVSHEVLEQVLRSLLINGLAELDGGDLPHFVITQKGEEFLQEYRHFLDMLDKYGFVF